MKVLMIEGEENANTYLRQIGLDFAAQNFELTCLNDFDSAEKWLLTYPNPDLIISEIHLRNQSIFDLHKKVSFHSSVILITKSVEHALDAFQLNTIAYLVTPFTQESLLAAINKFFSLKNLLSESVVKKNTTQFIERFFVGIGNKKFVFTLNEVAFFLSEDKAVYLITTDGRRFIIDYTLDALKLQLNPRQFFRINRNVLVKVDAIESIRKYGSQQLVLTLNQGSTKPEFVVSRNNVQAFKRWVGG